VGWGGGRGWRVGGGRVSQGKGPVQCSRPYDVDEKMLMFVDCCECFTAVRWWALAVTCHDSS
jgi:hypothetical protein